MRGKFRRLAQFAETKVSSIPREDIERTVDNVHAYIDVLIGTLKTKHPDAVGQLDRIEKLLKEMTDADPENRPTAAQAAQVLESILL